MAFLNARGNELSLRPRRATDARDARDRRSTRASSVERRKAFVFAIRSVDERVRDDRTRGRAWACDRFDCFGIERASDPRP